MGGGLKPDYQNGKQINMVCFPLSSDGGRIETEVVDSMVADVPFPPVFGWGAD